MPDQGEDVHVGAAGADQDRESARPLVSGSWACTAPEAEQPDTVHQPELVDYSIARGEPGAGQGLLGQPGPAGGPEALVHGEGSAEVLLGRRGVPERGRQRAEVVVDGGVVGSAAPHDHMGSRRTGRSRS